MNTTDFNIDDEELQKKILQRQAANSQEVTLTDEEIQASDQKVEQQQKVSQIAGVLEQLGGGQQQASGAGKPQSNIDKIIAAKKATSGFKVVGKAGERAGQAAQASGGNPYAAAAGAVIGVGEGLIKRNQAKKDLKVAEKTALADIESDKQNKLQGNIQSFISSLRSIL